MFSDYNKHNREAVKNIISGSAESFFLIYNKNLLNAVVYIDVFFISWIENISQKNFFLFNILIE